MTHHRSPSTRESARRPGGDAYWSVQTGTWSSVRPGLSAHLVDLLAPPIVVGVGRSDGTAVSGRPTGRRADGVDASPSRPGRR